MPKFAFLVMYELRCLKHIDKLYKYIIDFYDADIIICCQDLPDKQENVDMFDRKVVYKEVYKKPNISEYYADNTRIKIPGNNWNNERACLQVWINFSKMADVVEKFKDNYDYFIQMRTDVDILFPFPDKDLFETIPKGIYSFSPNYSKIWGGFPELGFIHKDYIIQTLTAFNNIIKNNEIDDTFFIDLNAENFMNKCLNYYNLIRTPIHCLNYIFIANDTNSHYTWAYPSRISIYDGVIKYPQQVSEVLELTKLWNKEYRWKFTGDSITLIGSN